MIIDETKTETTVKIPILLVEDSDTEVSAIQRAFLKNNMTNIVHVAKDGLDALEKLRGTNGQAKLSPFPRIIVLDINMPRMDGIEFLKALRSDASLHHLIVIIFTGSDRKEDVISTYNLNISGYIKKPLDSDELIKIIHELNDFWLQLQYPPEH